MKAELTIDAEFQSLIPPLSAQEFDSLRQQILEKGCLEPLYVWKDGDIRVLLDGHNRHSVCNENNLPFNFVKVPLASREEAKLWILEHQAGRRNLTDDQRAVMWNDIRELRSKVVQAEKLQKAREAKGFVSISADGADIARPKKDTRNEVAKEAKISESKLRQAQKLKKHHPDLYEKVRSGALTLRASNLKPLKNAPRRKNQDFFRCLSHKLDLIFKGSLKEKLNELLQLKQREMTPAANKGLQQIVLLLKEVANEAGSYAAKLEEILARVA